MKNPIPVYVYQHQEFICKAPSVAMAASMADTSATTARGILNGKLRCTRDGYYFSYDELTDEQIREIPDAYQDKHRITRVNGSKCAKDIDEQRYEVNCKNPLVTYIPRKTEDRKRMLKMVTYKACRDRWRVIPRKMATLERTMISELIDSL